VFVVHGEETVATGFAADLQSRFGWNATAPMPGASVTLE
jgi:metallo-beta-lactamase family protein